MRKGPHNPEEEGKGGGRGTKSALPRLAAFNCKLLAPISLPSSSLASSQLRSKTVWGMGPQRILSFVGAVQKRSQPLEQHPQPQGAAPNSLLTYFSLGGPHRHPPGSSNLASSAKMGQRVSDGVNGGRTKRKKGRRAG